MDIKNERAPFVSVVLCTYNRVDLLKGALTSLCKQLPDGGDFELIIVDNNSNDGTKEYSQQCSDRFENVFYVFERQQGLSHARNCGLAEARGEYIAYIDDDCEVSGNYITRLVQVLREKNPAVLGGSAYALYKYPKPEWYKDEYAQHVRTDKARELNDNEYAYGFNMVFRRVYLEQAGGFDTSLGMSGDVVEYGEDIVPQMLIRKMLPGEVFFYDPELIIFNVVRPEKMTLRWAMQSKYKLGKFSSKLHNSEDPGLINKRIVLRKSLACVLGLIKDAVVGALTRDKNVYIYYQNYLYEHTSEYLRQLGKLHQTYHLSRKT